MSDLLERLGNGCVYESSPHVGVDEVATEALLEEAADRITALETERDRLREALELADAALSGANMDMKVVERKVRAALAGGE